MVTASFRFYERLNDFLAPARRQRDFSAACARDATTKHMIEALGVPHTEVDLLLVNGEPAGLDRILRDGDRVTAYPRFLSLDLGPLPCLGERLSQAPRFVADSHLGALARLLRMAGFDTLYRNDFGDREIASLAAAEDRILLTRDRELLKLRSVGRGCYLHALKPAQQFRELAERLDFAGWLRPFSLCLECNAALRAVDKASVAEALPPSVKAGQDQFTRCDRCGRVYWPGSHWRRMRQLLDRLLDGEEPAAGSRTASFCRNP